MAEKKAAAKTAVKKAPAKVAPKATMKATAKAKAPVAKGDAYICGICGLVVTVDETCGCVDTCDIICCDQPMQARKVKVTAGKK